MPYEILGIFWEDLGIKRAQIEMTLEDLRIFVAAAETGSMGELARTLGLTQPAVAHHIRRLEKELRAPLLERTRRGVSLTVAGRALYDRATAALGALSTAETEVARLRGEGDGELSISASSGMVRHTLKPAILTLRRQRPELDFRLVCSNTRDQQLSAIRERRADLAFIAQSGDTPGFQFRRAVQMPYALLVHAQDALASRARIDLRRLAEVSFIAVGSDSATATFVAEQLAKRDRDLAVAHTVDTEGTAILYVELGLGQVVLPAVQAVALAKRSELVAVAIRGLPPLTLGWAARDFELLSRPTHDFLDIFEATIRKDGLRG